MTGPGATGKTRITPARLAGTFVSGGVLFGVCLAPFSRQSA